MFSEQLRQEAELRFQRQLPYFGQRKAEILCQMGQCSEEEQILMKFLYGTMPLRDVGVYDFSVFSVCILLMFNGNIPRSVLPGTEQTVTVYLSCTVKYLTEHSVDNRKNQFVSETEDVESGSAFRTIGVFSLPGICMIT